jgi:N-acetylneuraminate synthase
MAAQEIKIAGRKIGADHPPYVIAELSANHNGSLDRALEVIQMAKSAGADAVKIQTYTADTMTIDCDREDFMIRGGLWDGYSLYGLYRQAYTPFEWHKDIFEYSRKLGITCFSTPFDESAVDLLEDLNAPAYKIASFEAIDLPLIEYVARTKKPLIISTGMASYEEIGEAVDAAMNAGCEELVLLHCISGYPTPVDQANLRTLPDIAGSFGVVPGISDHTLGTVVSVASVALGACVIEKHVTLSREDKGPDSEFSIEPDELRALCGEARAVWSALGSAGYERKDAEKENVKFRRSIYAVEDIRAGEKFTEKNIRRIRPGYGLAPKYYGELMGRSAKTDLPKGTALKWEYVE